MIGRKCPVESPNPENTYPGTCSPLSLVVSIFLPEDFVDALDSRFDRVDRLIERFIDWIEWLVDWLMASSPVRPPCGADL